jgi:hypothetical protein
MMLEDVYGSDQDRFPLEQESEQQESELWAEDCPSLEWVEETEIRTLARDLSGLRRFAE